MIHSSSFRPLLLALLTMLPLCGMAQEPVVRKGDCTPSTAGDAEASARAAMRRLPAINNNWNPNKTYRQLVILFSFSDLDFTCEHPHETYDSIFNYPGYNQRNGPGCVAEYYREQSGGMLNMQFDVYGPIKVSGKACPYEKPTENTRNYGTADMTEALKAVIADNPALDFSLYDWDGDGYVNQVVYVYAGYSGNESAQKCYGHIWPNTGTFSTITTSNGIKIKDYTASAELWSNNRSCGMGTICHEFTHSLGLPDIYPTSGNTFSAVDEWDLMDGGNFTNYGWCPPNFSPLEKMLLGWLSPTPLSEPTSVTGMKTLNDGGEAYIIKHTDDEYLLLENRQQKGWDYGLPGKGLVIYHVNYSASKWAANTLNVVSGSNPEMRYQLVHADNLDYDAWYDLLDGKFPYANSPRLNSMILSTSPYPWSTDSTETVNRELTDSSVPSSKMQNPNAEGSYMLSKAITNIEMSADGLISFDFMKDSVPSGIAHINLSSAPAQTFDLNGCRRQANGGKGLFIIRRADGTVKKVFR